MRTRARRRRCAHHGIPRITVAITAIAGSGRRAGPTAFAAASHPPDTVTIAVAYIRSGSRVMPHASHARVTHPGGRVMRPAFRASLT